MFIVHAPDAPLARFKDLPRCASPEWAKPREFATIKQAERSARTLARLHPARFECYRGDTLECVFTTIRSPDGRVWTDVMPGAEVLL